jgi:hypothetical protein
MKVTPTKNRIGIYKPGDTFELPDVAAKHLIRLGIVRKPGARAAAAPEKAAAPTRTYKRRDMTAES